MTQIRIKQATSADFPKLAELMNSEYARKKDNSYFLWQYTHSYFPTALYCASFKTKLIGMFGLRKRKLSNGIFMGQVIDVLVAKIWRRKGIFKKLYLQATSHFPDLKAYCILANRNGKDALQKGFGWKNIGRINKMERLIYPTNVNLHDSRHLEGGCIDSFQVEESGNKLIKFPKNMNYYIWRFINNPEYKYQRIPKTGRFAVTKIFIDPETNKRYGDIVDIFCPLNNSEKLYGIYLKACQYLETQNIESITTWALPGTTLYPILNSMRFKQIPQDRFLVVHCLEKKYNYLYNFSHWHLSPADTDLF